MFSCVLLLLFCHWISLNITCKVKVLSYTDIYLVLITLFSKPAGWRIKYLKMYLKLTSLLTATPGQLKYCKKSNICSFNLKNQWCKWTFNAIQKAWQACKAKEIENNSNNGWLMKFPLLVWREEVKHVTVAQDLLKRYKKVKDGEWFIFDQCVCVTVPLIQWRERPAERLHCPLVVKRSDISLPYHKPPTNLNKNTLCEDMRHLTR